jgi:tetratricopeptide (TPR) repeat protein
LQPRVLDLLFYLVRNGDRVVGKDELLDAVWPGVIVTESSLQRAISLARGALRQGGLGEALRSFPRYGYRFCPEAPCAPAAEGAAGKPIDRARDAMARCDWPAAVAAFAQADAADEMSAADLVQWALAIECAGRPGEAVEPLMRAVAAFGMGGQPLAAADAALRVSRIHFDRGELAVARGWHSRAAQLIGGNRDCREYGLLLWMGSRIVSQDGDAEGALALAEESFAVGRRLGEPEVEALALMFRGFYRLCLGQARDGLDDQDHAAALALSSGVDPVIGCTVHCTILWSCRSFADWSRANQWSQGYQRWCRDSGLPAYTGPCQLHRAEVLLAQGALDEAERHVRDAMAILSVEAPWAVGDAWRLLGDVHMARDAESEAETAYDRAYAEGWDPQPGHAMLLLTRGEAEAASRALERALEGRGWWTLQRRGVLLAHLALTAAMAGDAGRARDLIAGIEDKAANWPMPSIRALTAQARAELARRAGDKEQALRQLDTARSLWLEAESPLQAAEMRLAVAALRLERGDTDGAAMEFKAACAAARRLDSQRLSRRCREVETRLRAARAAT